MSTNKPLPGASGDVPPALIEILKKASTSDLREALAFYTDRATHAAEQLEFVRIIADMMDKTVICIEEQLFERTGEQKVPWTPPLDGDEPEKGP